MLMKIITSRPCENKETKKAQKEQKARFRWLVQFNVNRIVQFSILYVVISIHELAKISVAKIIVITSKS